MSVCGEVQSGSFHCTNAIFNRQILRNCYQTSSHTCWCVFGHRAFHRDNVERSLKMKWCKLTAFPMAVKNEGTDRRYIIINRWKRKVSTLKEKQALPIVFIWHVPFWIDNNLQSWESATEDFLWRLFWAETRQDGVRPYLSNSCHMAFGITLTESIFYALLPHTSTLFPYPSPPFYLNAEVSNLAFRTAAARGFFVLKAPFHLLLEARMLLVFMKARARSLIQAVNLA